MGLTREAILAAKFERLKRVSVPEWGGDVWIKAMTAGDRDDFEAAHRAMREAGDDPLRDVKIRLVIATACDEAGVKLFADADAATLREHPAGAIDALADVAMELAGMTRRDAETLAAQLKKTNGGSSPTA